MGRDVKIDGLTSEGRDSSVLNLSRGPSPRPPPAALSHPVPGPAGVEEAQGQSPGHPSHTSPALGPAHQGGAGRQAPTTASQEAAKARKWATKQVDKFEDEAGKALGICTKSENLPDP